MTVVYLALIGAGVSLVTSVVAPIIHAHLTNAARAKEKAQDWARQDEVARRAEATAAEAKKAVDQVVVAAKVMDGKLDAIHTLGNSGVVAGLQRELDDSETKLVMMKEIIGLRESSGQQPQEGSQAGIVAIEKKIKILKSDLEERARQTTIAESQMAKP